MEYKIYESTPRPPLFLEDNQADEPELRDDVHSTLEIDQRSERDR